MMMMMMMMMMMTPTTTTTTTTTIIMIAFLRGDNAVGDAGDAAAGDRQLVRPVRQRQPRPNAVPAAVPVLPCR